MEGSGRRGVDGGELTRGSGIDDLAAAVGAAAASNRDAVREMASHTSLTSEHAESQAAASQLTENAARLSRMVSTFRV